MIQQNGDFSSDPHQHSRNFIRGKISCFWAQRRWNFWNRTCISEIMSIWNFDVFQEDWTKKFLELCCWNFNWLSLLFLWIFSFNILQWSTRLHAEQNNTESFSLVTSEPWLIIVIRQHVFYVHSSLTIFKIPITQIVQFQLTSFFYVRAGVMEILLYLGHPCLVLNFRQKKYVYIIVYTRGSQTFGVMEPMKRLTMIYEAPQ